jgi:hypothetical protein
MSITLVLEAAAAVASEPYESDLPFGAVMKPFSVVREPTTTPSCAAAASSNRRRTPAAAMRTGWYSDLVVFDPPVNWLNSSVGVASASVTMTSDNGRSISSAMIIAMEVVMP